MKQGVYGKGLAKKKNKSWHASPPDKEPRKGALPVARRQLFFDEKRKIWTEVKKSSLVPVSKSLVKGDFLQRLASLRKEVTAMRDKGWERQSQNLYDRSQELLDRLEALKPLAVHRFSQRALDNATRSKKKSVEPAPTKRISPSRLKRRLLREIQFGQGAPEAPPQVEVQERIVEVEVVKEVIVEKIVEVVVVKEVVVEKIVTVEAAKPDPIIKEVVVYKDREVPMPKKVILEKDALKGMVLTSAMSGIFTKHHYASTPLGEIYVTGLKVGKVLCTDFVFSRNGNDRIVMRASQKTNKVASNLVCYEDEALLVYMLGRLFEQNPLRDSIP